MSKPGTADLDIYRGDCDHWTFNLYEDDEGTTPYDITGATAAAQIRSAPGSAVMGTLACVVVAPNTVEVDLTKAVSESLTAGPARWDLELTLSDGCVRTVVAGAVTVTADITGAGAMTFGNGTRKRETAGR